MDKIIVKLSKLSFLITISATKIHIKDGIKNKKKSSNDESF